MKLILIAAVILAGCASTKQIGTIDPPAAVEASCPSTLLFEKEPLAGWKSMYENCRNAVFALKS